MVLPDRDCGEEHGRAEPSEKDPSASNWLAELFSEAGLPDGVFNVVHGDKEAVDALLVNPDVEAISFIGSTPIAKYIYETAPHHGKRVQAPGGAKSHMLVLPDADLDLAADAAINAGFGSAGERCMAISVVVAVEPVADELVAKITERMKGLEVGVDGRGIEVDSDASGFWLGLTLFDRVSEKSAVYQDEIFGPVLSVVRVANYADSVELMNRSQYATARQSSPTTAVRHAASRMRFKPE